jgi:hypothetical protein
MWEGFAQGSGRIPSARDSSLLGAEPAMLESECTQTLEVVGERARDATSAALNFGCLGINGPRFACPKSTIPLCGLAWGHSHVPPLKRDVSDSAIRSARGRFQAAGAPLCPFDGNFAVRRSTVH